MAKTKGLSRLQRKLRRIPSRVKADVARALQVSADEISALQKTLAPRDDGDLVASIRNSVDREALRATMEAGGVATTRPVRRGADAEYDYALAQEFGTKEMSANPFFFPAYRALRRRARSRISRSMTAAVRKAARDGA